MRLAPLPPRIAERYDATVGSNGLFGPKIGRRWRGVGLSIRAETTTVGNDGNEAHTPNKS